MKTLDTRARVATVGACPSRISAGPDPLTHYVVVRNDLPVGVLAAQLIHAAGESSPGNVPEGTYAIALAVPNERALELLAVRLLRARVAFTAIREPDAPYNGALMALGLAPRLKSQLRRHLSDLPLLRSAEVVQAGHLTGPQGPVAGDGGSCPPLGASTLVAQR